MQDAPASAHKRRPHLPPPQQGRTNLSTIASALPFFVAPLQPAYLISIDLEAHEHDHTIITELGLAILDTSALRPSPPPLPEQCAPLIHATHLLVAETRHLINKTYVPGRPDAFHHGATQVLPRAACVALASRILADPGCVLPCAGSGSKPVVLVGHNLASDLTFLAALGVRGDALDGVVGELDTQRMCSGRKRPVGLGAVLEALGIEARDLHNAGNDAVATMRALVGMVGVRVEGEGAWEGFLGRVRTGGGAGRGGGVAGASGGGKSRGTWKGRRAGEKHDADLSKGNGGENGGHPTEMDGGSAKSGGDGGGSGGDGGGSGGKRKRLSTD